MLFRVIEFGHHHFLESTPTAIMIVSGSATTSRANVTCLYAPYAKKTCHREIGRWTKILIPITTMCLLGFLFGQSEYKLQQPLKAEIRQLVYSRAAHINYTLLSISFNRQGLKYPMFSPYLQSELEVRHLG